MGLEEAQAKALFDYAMDKFPDEFENLLREWASEGDEFVHVDNVAQAYHDRM